MEHPVHLSDEEFFYEDFLHLLHLWSAHVFVAEVDEHEEVTDVWDDLLGHFVVVHCNEADLLVDVSFVFLFVVLT